MQIQGLLLNALRDRDPQQFNRLSRGGKLDEWVKARLAQAKEIYERLTAAAEKLPNGVVKDPALRAAAEEQAIAAVTDDLTDEVPQVPRAKTTSSGPARSTRPAARSKRPATT